MEQVTGRTFRGGEKVDADGVTFIDCTFESAQLVYRGGDHPAFDRCRFGSDVSWHFRGAALKTIQLLQRIGNTRAASDSSLTFSRRANSMPTRTRSSADFTQIKSSGGTGQALHGRAERW